MPNLAELPFVTVADSLAGEVVSRIRLDSVGGVGFVVAGTSVAHATIAETWIRSTRTCTWHQPPAWKPQNSHPRTREEHQ